MTNCALTSQLKEQADLATSAFLKMFLLDSIESLRCGERSDETVCCDKQLETGKINDS